MKFIKHFLCIQVCIFTCIMFYGQLKDPKIEKVRIEGNCEMCKTTIEKTGSKKIYLKYLGMKKAK